MIDRFALLQRLDSERENPLVRRIRRFLEREDTRVVSNRSVKVSVSEVRRLWSTRLKNTDLTGQKLDGAESLLGELNVLAQNRKLEQVAFVGSKHSGNVFFQATSPHRFVGAIVFAVPTRQDRS